MSADGRLVISGIGVVSPLGIGATAFWEALLAGRSAIAAIRRFDPGAAAPRLAAEVADFPAREFLPPALVRRMDRLSQMIGVASVLAAREAGLAAGSDELAVVVGSSLGNLSESAQFLDRVFSKGPALANPMLFPNLVMNAPASQVSMALGWRGPNLTLSAGEISGEAALDVALGLLRRGRARAVVVAAGEEISEIFFQACRDLRLLAPRRRGRERSCPFDSGADGPVLGEGAAALVVETLESARSRGARVYAAIERVERFQLPVSSPHAWPRLEAVVATPAETLVSPDIALCGADSSAERDRLEIELLTRLVSPGCPLYSLAGALGTHASQGLATLAVAALALSSGRLPPLVGLERPRSEARFQLPQSEVAGAWSRAAVLGTARGGAAALVELSRQQP